ncbi:MAG: hypothetical protein WCI65_03260 [Synechococcaceae cyanobacterium ELA263]
MARHFTPEQLHRVRMRHRGYGYLLLVICLVLVLQPLAVDWPVITSLNSITVALVMMLFLTRYSPLRSKKRWIYGLGVSSIGIELIWLTSLAESPGMALHLTIPRLVIWSLFITIFLVRKVRALMLEPYVTLGVLQGAAAGYLLIGYLGAFLLHTLFIFQPIAFNIHYLPSRINPITEPLRVPPSMVAASYEALTAVSNSISSHGYLLGHIGTLVITLLGQLYIAVLIGLVLGRFHQHQER